MSLLTTRVPSIAFRDFRLLTAAILANSAGMMGQIVVLGWVVLEMTDSPFWVSVALGIRFAPNFLLGIVAGALVDRVDKGRFINWMNVGLCVVAVLTGIVVLNGMSLPWILALTFTSGVFQASFQTARQGYVNDLVGSQNVINGMAVSTVAMRSGGLVGPLAGGLITARFGGGEGFIALSSVYVVSYLLLMTVSRPRVEPNGSSVMENLRSYVVALREHPTLFKMLLLTATVEVVGFSYMVLLPSLARDVLEVGADGLGLMTSVRAIGGIGSVLVVTVIGPSRRNGLPFMIVLHAFGAAIILLGLAPSFLFVLVALTLVDAAAALTDVYTQGLMQLSAPEGMRGRAGGSWVFAIGTQPVGNLQVGVLASLISVPAALVINGVALVGVGAVSLLVFKSLRRL
ncbi:MAG: MFS transporter [Dehalococcoidia bacterium]|jgi:MFS family permease|nr:MFS transporter [Dehalococcoidia bacterium]